MSRVCKSKRLYRNSLSHVKFVQTKISKNIMNENQVVSEHRQKKKPTTAAKYPFALTPNPSLEMSLILPVRFKCSALEKILRSCPLNLKRISSRGVLPTMLSSSFFLIAPVFPISHKRLYIKFCLTHHFKRQFFCLVRFKANLNHLKILKSPVSGLV